MGILNAFLKAATDEFDYFQSAGPTKYEWRTLVFATERSELEKVALDSLTEGLAECKISRTPFKRNNIYVLTAFHPSIAEALGFRSRWYENPLTAVAGPIPLAPIEAQFLQREQSAQAAAQVMLEICGTSRPGDPLRLDRSRS